VADLYGEAVFEVTALELDDAVGCGEDRLSHARLVIDAIVETAAREASVVSARSERR
jgi:hypothetical protein